MSGLRSRVRTAQRRLWLNRWLEKWGWSLFIITAALTLEWVVNRLFVLHSSTWLIPLVGLGVSVIAASVWSYLTRDSELDAAGTLDVAAGLRERVSSALSIGETSDDPFRAAVVADAERATAGLTPKRFVPLRWPGSMSWGTAMILIGLLSLLLPEFDVLGRRDSKVQAESQRLLAQRTTAALAKPVTAMQEAAEKAADPTLAQEVKELEALRERKDVDSAVKRREAMKTLDRLQDALKKQADDDLFKALNETKKRLRQIGAPSDPKSDVAQLMDSLSKGDFAEAQKEIEKLKENLAKKAKNGEMTEEKKQELQKQLNELAKKMEQAAQNKQDQEQLQKAGMSEAEAQRVLETLAKKDPKQLEKMAKELAEKLKEKGVSEQQMKEMLQKMQQNQKSSNQCKSMANQMKKAGNQIQEGNMAQAQEELSEAGQQLSEMEQMEQAMNDIESQMSQLDESKQEMEEMGDQESSSCGQCKGGGFQKDGSPCPHCNGDGQGPGGRGRGSGNRARDDSAQTSTVDRKAKTKEGKGGSVIGQQFVKGKQLKGQSSVEFSEAAPAAEINATDALNKDRIPRSYRQSVKKFFDHLGDDFDDSGKKTDADKTDKPAQSSEKK